MHRRQPRGYNDHRARRCRPRQTDVRQRAHPLPIRETRCSSEAHIRDAVDRQAVLDRPLLRDPLRAGLGLCREHAGQEEDHHPAGKAVQTSREDRSLGSDKRHRSVRQRNGGGYEKKGRRGSRFHEASAEINLSFPPCCLFLRTGMEEEAARNKAPSTIGTRTAFDIHVPIAEVEMRAGKERRSLLWGRSASSEAPL